MVNRCPTCSQAGGERSNPQAEARCGKPASRNASELDSASLHYMGVAILSDRVELQPMFLNGCDDRMGEMIDFTDHIARGLNGIDGATGEHGSHGPFS